MEAFESRYRFDESWTRTGSGELTKAFDLKLKRQVLVYRMNRYDDVQLQEAMRWLSKAARFTDKRFLPVLDVGAEGGALYAVLPGESGAPLSSRLREIQWTGREMCERLLELIAGIREARREKLPEFAVTPDNIWLDGEGRLRFLNYWTEAEANRRDVRGLTSVLYQIASGQEAAPVSMSAVYQALLAVLTDLPGGDAEQAADWAISAFQPSYSLREYEQELKRLLEETEAALDHTPSPLPKPKSKPKSRSQPQPQPQSNSETRPRSETPPQSKPETRQHSASKPKPYRQAAVLQPSSKRATPPSIKKEVKYDAYQAKSASFRLRPWHLLAAAVFGICLVVTWSFLTRSEGWSPANTGELPSMTASATSTPTAAPASFTPGKSPSPSATATPKPSASAQAAGAAASREPQGYVPDLIGHTKEEAEELVLQAGLRYQFFLEPNDMAKDLVFKQDLIPGTPVQPGDKIVFSVSKGK